MVSKEEYQKKQNELEQKIKALKSERFRLNREILDLGHEMLKNKIAFDEGEKQ